ncbi:hypothetical protein IH799_00805 [candidate division KSB1 bacterium]|nr:hypothetical protein [candidate division KSB1 bacterium]
MKDYYPPLAENQFYHVFNRGNNRAEVFHKSGDYARFTEMLGEAVDRLPLRVLSWGLNTR